MKTSSGAVVEQTFRLHLTHVLALDQGCDIQKAYQNKKKHTPKINIFLA